MLNIVAPASSYVLIKSGYQGKTGYADTNIKSTPRSPRIVGSWMS